jgi:hypothetical protein
MSQEKLSRRVLLAVAGAATLGLGVAAAEPERPRIRPGDPRYDSLLRGNNFRFVGRPDEIRVVTSTDDVVRVVGEAARAGRRVAARSGGHCFENFTADPAVRTLLDLSPMNAVTYDARMRAFAVRPGATLGQVYRALFKGWGVTIPAGSCPEVGAGGHFAGGATARCRAPVRLGGRSPVRRGGRGGRPHRRRPDPAAARVPNADDRVRRRLVLGGHDRGHVHHAGAQLS